MGLASALGGLHKVGLIHKDIKPANVLFDSIAGEVRLMGFGVASRLPRVWLREGVADSRAAHIGFVANTRDQVDSAYASAIAEGATDNGVPSIRPYYDPRYYAANVLDPDGYSIEFVHKSWHHSKKSEPA